MIFIEKFFHLIGIILFSTSFLSPLQLNLHFDGISQGLLSSSPILARATGAVGTAMEIAVDTAHYRTESPLLEVYKTVISAGALRFEVAGGRFEGRAPVPLRPSKTIRPMGPSQMITYLPDRPKQPHLTYPDIS